MSLKGSCFPGFKDSHQKFLCLGMLRRQMWPKATDLFVSFLSLSKSLQNFQMIDLLISSSNVAFLLLFIKASGLLVQLQIVYSVSDRVPNAFNRSGAI